MKRRAFLAGAAALMAAPARGETVAKAEALSGDRFMAAEKEFHLCDILAPSPYSLRDDAEPYFEGAKRACAELLNGADILIERDLGATRWGARIVVARRASDILTLQERLVEAGAARVAPLSDDFALIDQLLTAEDEARNARRGLWRLDPYGVFRAGAAEGAVGAFHLVEGEVLRAALAGTRFYLNFGADYRTDFTAGAASAVYRRWASDGFDLKRFEGTSVRIRGFVEAINGPSIDLSHQRQIEILDSF
jgi:endonuclease YncB( thermonuclease family)